MTAPEAPSDAMWPDTQQTQHLLDQARAGEPGAVDELLARHRDALRRVVDLRLDPALARRVDASDIVQEALIEANRRLAEYLRNPVMPFHLWLRHLAKDRMIDAHRRHREAQRRSLDREQALRPAAWAGDESSVQLLAQLVDRERTPASAAMEQELRRRFEEALAQLPEDDREIILMRHHEQLSNQEVAAALEVTESAASMRYLRAQRRLRVLLVPESGG